MWPTVPTWICAARWFLVICIVNETVCLEDVLYRLLVSSGSHDYSYSLHAATKALWLIHVTTPVVCLWYSAWHFISPSLLQWKYETALTDLEYSSLLSKQNGETLQHFGEKGQITVKIWMIWESNKRLHSHILMSVNATLNAIFSIKCGINWHLKICLLTKWKFPASCSRFPSVTSCACFALFLFKCSLTRRCGAKLCKCVHYPVSVLC